METPPNFGGVSTFGRLRSTRRFEIFVTSHEKASELSLKILKREWDRVKERILP
jgi:hypothetical protein